MSILNELKEVTEDNTLYWEKMGTNYRLWTKTSNISDGSGGGFIVSQFNLTPISSSFCNVGVPNYIALMGKTLSKVEGNKDKVDKIYSLLNQTYQQIAYNLGFSKLLTSLNREYEHDHIANKKQLYLINDKWEEVSNFYDRRDDNFVKVFMKDVVNHDKLTGWDSYDNHLSLTKIVNEMIGVED